MAYRITRGDVVIEADSAEDVQSLLLLIDKPLLPMMTERRTIERAPKPPKKAPRGASDGSLDGRVLSALSAGPLAPGALCEAVKAERYNVALSLKTLESRGLVKVEGATTKRLASLTAKAPKPKEAVQ